MGKWEEILGAIAFFLDGGTTESDDVPYLRSPAYQVQSINFAGDIVRINGTTIEKGSFGAILRMNEIRAISQIMKRKKIIKALRSGDKRKLFGRSDK